MKTLIEGLTYDDVSLVPQISSIPHRNADHISLKGVLGNIRLDLPIVSAPMDTVTEGDMVLALRKHGALGIVHRYNEILEQAAIVKECGAQAAAISMSGDFMERAWVLVENGVKILCIDTAHGHHTLMKEALGKLRAAHGDSVHLMAGSIATAEAAEDLCRWGADSLRVGIGGGAVCTTRLHTGCGVPNITAIKAAAHGAATWWNTEGFRTNRSPKIIADGGIRDTGDMVKAFAAGAHLVMLGSMLAGTAEAPGEVIDTAGGQKKIYRGMASREAQNDWRGSSSAPEGVSVVIPYKGPVDKVLEHIPGRLRSGLSYNGATSLLELRKNAEFIRQTSAGTREGNPHINS